MLPVMTVPEARVVKDPDLRFAPSGVAVGSFRIVCSSRKKNDHDEWVDDKTLWLDVTCFKQLAENVAESLRKGDLVSVTGRLQTDEWESESGEKRSKTLLIADAVAVNLRFRTVKHGEGQTEHASAPATDQWTTPAATGTPPQSEDPPF